MTQQFLPTNNYSFWQLTTKTANVFRAAGVLLLPPWLSSYHLWHFGLAVFSVITFVVGCRCVVAAIFVIYSQCFTLLLLSYLCFIIPTTTTSILFEHWVTAIQTNYHKFVTDFSQWFFTFPPSSPPQIWRNKYILWSEGAGLTYIGSNRTDQSYSLWVCMDAS